MADPVSPTWLRIRSADRRQTASTGTHRSRSSVAGTSTNGDIPHGLKCTPARRTRAGYSSRKRRVHMPMNQPSVTTAGGTAGSESHSRTGPPRLTNRWADGIGGTVIRRWYGTPDRK